MPIWTTMRVGLMSALGFAAALTGASLAAGVGAPPIVPALIASLVMAAGEWARGVTSPHLEADFSAAILIRWLVTVLTAIGLVAILAVALPRGVQFVCEPLVPWRISIVLFGAFFSAWMAASMSLRSPGAPRHWLIPIALSWIAPFYGFFHAPWFLAQSLSLPCPDRPLAQCLIASGGMALAALSGARTAGWMFATQRG